MSEHSLHSSDGSRGQSCASFCLDPLGEPRPATPKRRCFKHLWARSHSESDKQPSPQVFADAAVVDVGKVALSPLDKEFDDHFEMPQSFDTVPRWKCPIIFAEWQRRTILFADLQRKSQTASSQTASSVEVDSRVSASIVANTSVVSAQYRSDSSDKSIQPSNDRGNHASRWAMFAQSAPKPN
jgi:hypothetical protein